jgi:hypothetical protein
LNVTDLTELIDNLKLNDKYETKDIENIFNEFDTKKTGEVHFNDFIKSILEKSQDSQETKYSSFYLSAINFFLTPSERITETIKKAMKEIVSYNKSSSIVKELDWVIHTLSEKDLFDFRLKDEYISDTEFENNDILKFLSEYSHEGFNRQKLDDLKLCNTISLKKQKLKDCKFIFKFSKEIVPKLK